jgi:hypothetical protein
LLNTAVAAELVGWRHWDFVMDKPPPTFRLGQHVRVLLNDRNSTPHEGTVRHIIWHHKDARYNYYLQEGGKKVSKRYFEQDLEALE